MNFRITSVLSGLLIVAACTLQAQPILPYLNPNLPIDQRVDDLIGLMTLEEKASQMVDAAKDLPQLNVPNYGWWSEALHGVAKAGKATTSTGKRSLELGAPEFLKGTFTIK